jgi:hypothetical protein
MAKEMISDLDESIKRRFGSEEAGDKVFILISGAQSDSSKCR